MSWVKVDDRALAGPEMGRVSRDARLLHIEALAWSMSYDGTGVVPRSSLRRATDAADPEALAAELVRAGIWAATDDEYRVVFMMDDQLTPDEIARQRAYHRTRQERHRRHTKGDHSLCDPRYCSMASRETSPKTSRDASHDASRTRGDASHDASVTVPRPDPTRPKERGGSKDDGARSAPSGLRPSVAPLAKDVQGFDDRYAALDESHALCAVCGVVADLGETEMVNATFADGDSELVHEGCADDPRVVGTDADDADDEDPE